MDTQWSGGDGYGTDGERREGRGEGDVSGKSEKTDKWQVEGCGASALACFARCGRRLHSADGRCPTSGVGVFFAWVVVKEGSGMKERGGQGGAGAHLDEGRVGHCRPRCFK